MVDNIKQEQLTYNLVFSKNLGTYCLRNGLQEVKDLQKGMDFRKPEYRREVFLNFYEFHCKYNAHPGAVYYAFPWLFNKYQMTMEQKLWFCFINGLSQNVITTMRLYSVCTDPLSDISRQVMFDYFRENYTKLGWDTDRRYVKNSFEKAVNHYINLLSGRSQEDYFLDLCTGSDFANFDKVWDNVINKFYLFGRLSTFSYLEYLKIAGLPIDCSNLFLDDISGSKSHRNGLCKVLGRDDLDWTKDNPVKYSKEIINWLEVEAEKLLDEAKERGINASYFTLESTFCCYKSWFRKNRRYPNVYNDLFYERILRDEKLFGRENKLFRQLRQECLPLHLRVEDNIRDMGLCPQKQNHFRETGQVIMMDKDWQYFENDLNNFIDGK
jgi:Alpha-glutamyl/putrescinyl thymine pyrophosphorylase clade 2